MSKTVSICGAGWLGRPLAHHLRELGYSIKVSTTQKEKCSVLAKEGLNPCILSVPFTVSPPHSSPFFDADILVITLPFKRSFENPHDYTMHIQQILEYTQKKTSIIFTSSTSVYSETNDWVTEETEIHSPSSRQLALLNTEQLILDRNGTVLRLAGLYGPNRRIGGFLRHSKTPKSGNTPVNLVHLDDVIGVISTLVNRPIEKNIFNVVSDHHPSRKELYTFHAHHQGFSPPEFTESQTTSFKLISNQRLKDMLGYVFKHPDPMSL